MSKLKWLTGPIGDPSLGEEYATLIEALMSVYKIQDTHSLAHIKRDLQNAKKNNTISSYRFMNYRDYRYVIKNMETDEIIWTEEEE